MRSAELAEATGSATTGSSCRPRSRTCATSSTSTGSSPRARDYPLHLGLTEAGLGMKGIVASTAGARDPAGGGDRRHDPRLADARARAASARRRSGSRSRSSSRWASARSCPRSAPAPAAAGRPRTFFQEMAERIQGHLRDRMPEWQARYPGVEAMTVAVMGCVVNGPGESKHADIGISLPGHVRGAGRAGLRRRQARPDAPGRRASSTSSSTSSRRTSSAATAPSPPRLRRPDLLHPCDRVSSSINRRRIGEARGDLVSSAAERVCTSTIGRRIVRCNSVRCS